MTAAYLWTMVAIWALAAVTPNNHPAARVVALLMLAWTAGVITYGG